MTRTLSIKNIYQKRFRTMPFAGDWAIVFGEPEHCGLWLIWGAEKNGKTWFALKLAGYLSTFEQVLYVSAEEGTGKAFVDTCRRAGLGAEHKRLHFSEYIAIPELEEKIGKRKSARIIFVDNCTIYADELKKSELLDFVGRNPDKLFIFVAHEERNEPYTATARLIRKLAKVIVKVEGLSCMVSGRVPGGILTIDEHRSRLYWGNEIAQNNQ
jgi:hypothetical protein